MLCKNCEKIIPDNSTTCPNCAKDPKIIVPEFDLVKLNITPVKFSKRFMNFLIDEIIITIIFYIIILTINPGFFLISFVASFFIALLYYIIFEKTFGQSIGKMITGTKVIDENHQKPTLKAITIRSLSRFIPLEPITVYLFDNNIGWHDSLSKTFVVKK